MGSFSAEEITEVFDFAYDMTFGGLGDLHDNTFRSRGEKFANLFQGKLGELAVFNELNRLGMNPSDPDYTVGGLGYWDHIDISINERAASVKSTKHIGQLLLLKTSDWDENGDYRYAMDRNQNIVPVSYDFNIMTRISPSCEKILRDSNMLNSDTAERECLQALISLDWQYDIPGFITRDDLRFLINENYILPQNAYYRASDNGNYTRMREENYYVRIADMHDLSELTNIITV